MAPSEYGYPSFNIDKNHNPVKKDKVVAPVIQEVKVKAVEPESVSIKPKKRNVRKNPK